MKNKKISLANYLGLFIALLCAGNIIWLASCKDSVTGDGLPNPVINEITSIDSSYAVVESTLAGTWLVIRGDNFLGTQHIYINDYDVPFNTTFVSNKYIVFQIPDKVTSGATIKPGETLSDELKVVTNHGTATHYFNVALPPPVIYTVTNELASAGTTISLLGIGFNGINKITFPGNIEVTTFNMDKNGTQISVVVPDNITEVGPIRISGVGLYYKTDSVFNSKGYMLCNFDDVNPYKTGTGNDMTVVDNAAHISGGQGNYAYALATNVGQWSWTSGATSFVTNPTQWVDPAIINDSVANYAFKFEYFLASPWIEGRFQIANNEWGGDAYRYYFKQWDPNTTPITPVSKGYWQTITIPLTYFLNADSGPATATDGTGSFGVPAVTFADFLNGTDVNKPLIFKMFFFRLPVPIFEGAFDNFRIVKVK